MVICFSAPAVLLILKLFSTAEAVPLAETDCPEDEPELPELEVVVLVVVVTVLDEDLPEEEDELDEEPEDEDPTMTSADLLLEVATSAS